MKKQIGFTLIELLVVITIIGLLSTLAVVAFNGARMKARDARRVADVKQIQTALALYYSYEDIYPVASGTVPSTFIGSPLKGPNSLITFIKDVPSNPISVDAACGSSAFYTYTQDQGGSSYTISFCLGAPTGGIIAGQHKATPAGIQ